MSDADGPWWLDDNRTWHCGDSGYAPGGAPERTDALRALVAPWPDPPPVMPVTETMPTAAARHLARRGERRRHRPGGQRSLSRSLAWTGIGVLSFATATVVVAAVLVPSDGEPDERAGPPRDEHLVGPAAGPTTMAPGTTSSSPRPAAEDGAVDPSTDDEAGGLASTTTSRAPATAPAPGSGPTSPPATSDPLAACSPGQRNLIERGNHPWEWYEARFDADGDGILCT